MDGSFYWDSHPYDYECSVSILKIYCNLPIASLPLNPSVSKGGSIDIDLSSMKVKEIISIHTREGEFKRISKSIAIFDGQCKRSP